MKGLHSCCTLSRSRSLFFQVQWRLTSNSQSRYPTVSVHIGRRYGELPELIEYHSKTVRQLEAVLTTFLKKGTIPDKRPTIRIEGFMGIGGQQHDAIEYLTAKVKRLETKIETARDHIDARRAQPYGFASFLKVVPSADYRGVCPLSCFDM